MTDKANVLPWVLVAQRHLLTLFFAALTSVSAVTPVQATDSHEPGAVQFSASDAVSNQRLSAVSGTGGSILVTAPRTHVSVILWDEPPVSKSGGTTAPRNSNTSQSMRASMNFR